MVLCRRIPISEKTDGRPGWKPHLNFLCTEIKVTKGTIGNLSDVEGS